MKPDRGSESPGDRDQRNDEPLLPNDATRAQVSGACPGRTEVGDREHGKLRSSKDKESANDEKHDLFPCCGCGQRLDGEQHRCQKERIRERLAQHEPAVDRIGYQNGENGGCDALPIAEPDSSGEDVRRYRGQRDSEYTLCLRDPIRDVNVVDEPRGREDQRRQQRHKPDVPAAYRGERTAPQRPRKCGVEVFVRKVPRRIDQKCRNEPGREDRSHDRGGDHRRRESAGAAGPAGVELRRGRHESAAPARRSADAFGRGVYRDKLTRAGRVIRRAVRQLE